MNKNEMNDYLKQLINARYTATGNLLDEINAEISWVLGELN